MRYQVIGFICVSILIICTLTASSQSIESEQLLSIAVVNFANLSGTYIPSIEDVAAEVLSALLAQTQKFFVLERERIESVAEEIGFIYSGLVDQERTAVELGKLLGADIVALGSILDYSESEIRYSGYGIIAKTTIYTMQVSLKLVEVSSGRIFYADVLDGEEKVLEVGPLHIGLQGVERRLLTKILRDFTNYISDLEISETVDRNQNLVEVQFESTPTGASVEIDGIYVGSTPLTYVLENGRVYQIRITYPDLPPWEMQVRAYAGLVVNATLAPQVEREGQ